MGILLLDKRIQHLSNNKAMGYLLCGRGGF